MMAEMMLEKKTKKERTKNGFLSSLLKFAASERDKWEGNRVAPISPTPMDMIHLVIADLGLMKTSRVVDLGCGDGRWLCAIATQFSCQCWGVDMDRERLTLARDAVIKGGCQSNVELLLADFSVCDLKHFSHVIVYLSRVGHEQLKTKLITQCLPGTVVISVGFQIRGWVPEHRYTASSGLAAYKYVTKSTNSPMATDICGTPAMQSNVCNMSDLLSCLPPDMHLCISSFLAPCESLALLNTCISLQTSLGSMDWRQICSELMLVPRQMHCVLGNVAQYTPVPAIPGLRQCGQQWPVQMIIDYVPGLCMKEITLDDVVAGIYGANTSTNWLRYYCSFVEPCRQCKDAVGQPMSFLNPDALAIQVQSNKKKASRLGLWKTLETCRNDVCHYHSRRMSVLEMRRNCYWTVEPRNIAGVVVVKTRQDRSRGRRGRDGELTARTPQELEAAIKMLNEERPHVDLRYDKGSIGVSHFLATDHVNRHGVARILSCGDFEGEYHYFDYGNSHTFLDSDEQRQEPGETRWLTVKSFFGWMNAANIEFLQSHYINRASLADVATFSHLAVRTESTSIGNMYSLNFFWTEEGSSNYDEC